MSIQEQEIKKKSIRNVCPYCNSPFKIKVIPGVDIKSMGITSKLIKPHDNCGVFLIFIDPNGAVRGTQCIDGKLGDDSNDIKENDFDFEKYVKLFEDQENITEFYYATGIYDGKLSSKGVITAKKVKYHKLLRSDLFKEWQNKTFQSVNGYGFMVVDNLIVISINLYDMILFTIGIEIESFDKDLSLNDLPSMIEYIKGKAVSLGEMILS